MTIIEQLAKLAKAAPDICHWYPSDNSFVIDQYRFWWQGEQFWGQTVGKGFGGQPALDWLQCALQRVIRARGWFVELKSYRQSVARIFSHEEPDTIGDWQNTPTEALLDALIKAVK